MESDKENLTNGRDDVAGEIINRGGGEIEVDLVWKLCNMSFENDKVPKARRTAVTVPLYKARGRDD